MLRDPQMKKKLKTFQNMVLGHIETLKLKTYETELQKGCLMNLGWVLAHQTYYFKNKPLDYISAALILKIAQVNEVPLIQRTIISMLNL
jgi:hypothetical protein